MSLEEEVFKSVLDTYRAQGLDLSAVLDDPIFRSLSLGTRIEVIKKYAKEVNSTSRRSITRSDIKDIIVSALATSGLAAGYGLVGGVMAGRLYQGAMPSAKAIIPGAALFGIGSGVVSGVSAYRKLLKDKALADNMGRVVDDPSTQNVAKLLTFHHLNRPGKAFNFADHIGSKLNDEAMSMAYAKITEGMKDSGQYGSMLDAQAANKPLHPGVDPETVNSITKQLKEKLNQP